MKRKNLQIFLLTLLVLLATSVTHAQISSSTAYRIISGSSLPATCDPGPGTTDVFIKTGASPGVYYCSSLNTWTASGGGGGTPGGSPTELQYNNAGSFGGVTGATSNGTNVTFGSGNLLATSPAFTTNQTTTNNAIGTTSTDGIVLQNTTAAAAGAQQYSPRLRLTGQGWKTTATAASQTVDWIVEVRPVQGAASPTSAIHFLSQVNGGGYTSRVNFGTDGYLNSNFILSTSSIQAGSNLIANTDVFVGNVTGPRIGNTTGTFQFKNNGNTAGANVAIGSSSVSPGTSAVGVFVIANGTAPSSSPADEFQMYSADSAAGDANAFIRNEAGEINRISGLAARNSSSFAKTADTTLANITGLTRNVEAGRAYAFTATLQTTAAATGGVKFAVSGTATATSISYEGVLVDSGAIVNQTRATALDTVVCASTTSTAGTCTIKGVVVINAAGTLTLQFAQNASDGGASTVLVNQFMQLVPIS